MFLNFASQSQIAKFKFRQYLISAVGGQIAKYNSRQIFRLYGITFTASVHVFCVM